jgi:hypothetical protein
MSFPDDLLEQAKHLAKREPRKPKQASLRRAISTAYYALFHLLISEATLNWRRAEQRPLLARFFEHGRMRVASDRQRSQCNLYINSNPSPLPGRGLECALNLKRVADTFVEAQRRRHSADYDSATLWTRTEVLTQVELVEGAFQSWRAIRDEPTAQAYLISLLGRSPSPA